MILNAVPNESIFEASIIISELAKDVWWLSSLGRYRFFDGDGGVMSVSWISCCRSHSKVSTVTVTIVVDPSAIPV